MPRASVSTSQELYDVVNGYSSPIANRRIELAGDIALDHAINVYNCGNVIIDGNGFKITSADDYTTDPLKTSYRLVNVTNSTGVTFTDITLNQGYNNNKASDIEQTGVGAVGVTAGFAAVVSAIGATVTKLFGRRK